MTNTEIADAIRCRRNDITGIRRRALAKCQRIAEHLKSSNTLTSAEIMADPIGNPQMEFIF